jgi:ferredoxin
VETGGEKATAGALKGRFAGGVHDGGKSGSKGLVVVELDVERDVCVGAGQCVLAAPEVFDQGDDDGLVVVLRDPGPGDERDVRQAVSTCPSQALRLAEPR